MNLIQIDKQLTTFLNSFHTPFLDIVMYNVSKTFIWLPFYLFLMFFLWRQYGNRVIWIKVIFLIALVFASDKTSVYWFKNVFERLRPCHDPDMVVRIYKRCGGHFGFVSSHATNVFALATFLYFQMKTKYKWIVWMFLWASIISYSRVYLGVHFVGDILCGAIWGSFVGFVVHKTENYSSIFICHRVPWFSKTSK